jgi:hypothetical protein
MWYKSITSGGILYKFPQTLVHVEITCKITVYVSRQDLNTDITVSSFYVNAENKIFYKTVMLMTCKTYFYTTVSVYHIQHLVYNEHSSVPIN